MRRPSLTVLALAGSLFGPQAFFAPLAFGQSVISARSGLVNYFEGVAFLDGQPLAKRAGVFARMKDGSTLLTESGRAEVLLTPDTYLRIGENSGIRMLSSDISDTRVEVISGSAILDSSNAPAGEFVKLVFRDSTIRIMKPGHYRVDAEPPQLRVYTGQAQVTKGGGLANAGQGDAGQGDAGTQDRGVQKSKPVTIEASQLFPLDGAPVVKRFTQGSDGLLDLWSDERDSLIASNMVNSQAISDPLLDSGPDVPADLAAYIGYAPLGTLPPLTASAPSSPYGYGAGYGIGYGGGYGVGYGVGYGFPSMYPGMPVGFYPGFGVGAFVPLPMNSGLYRRGIYGAGIYRPGYMPGFSPRPIYSPTGIGTVPRTVFGTRPITPVYTPRAGGVGGFHPGVGGVHPGVGVHAVGHR